MKQNTDLYILVGNILEAHSLLDYRNMFSLRAYQFQTTNI